MNNKEEMSDSEFIRAMADQFRGDAVMVSKDRLAELEKDSKRLDFIEQHPGWLHRRKGRWGCVNPFTNYSYPMFKTSREAIDAAMLEREE